MDVQTQRRDTQGRSPSDDTGRDWRDIATSQGLPRIAVNPQKLGRGKKRILEPSEGAWFYQSLVFRLLAPRTVRKHTSDFKPPVCGTLLGRLRH